MSTSKCALCGCEMTVETDGTPMHKGRHWPDIDRVFCLKRQLDAANACIKRLEDAGDELEAFCSAEGALRKWRKAKESK